MKRNLKKLFMAVAVSAVSVFAVLGASCDSSASEWIEDKIDQIKCEHVTTKVIERVLPTCTEKGYTEGLECVDCGKVVTKPDEVKALGHTIVTYEEVEATCLTKGKTEGEYCTVCETWLKEIKDIKATGHSVEVIEGKDPTCTETGLTNGQACDKCGEVYVAQKVIPALGHDVNDSGNCKVCGEFSLEALDLDNLYSKSELINDDSNYNLANGALLFVDFTEGSNTAFSAISALKNGQPMGFIPSITDWFGKGKVYLSAFDENGEDLMPGTEVSFLGQYLVDDSDNYGVMYIEPNGFIEFEDKDGNIYSFNVNGDVSVGVGNAYIYIF
jgi:hypothetical protein